MDALKKITEGLYNLFRVIYRPSSIKIAEACHKTIKAIDKRSDTSPTVAIFWYKMVPRLLKVENSESNYFTINGRNTTKNKDSEFKFQELDRNTACHTQGDATDICEETL